MRDLSSELSNYERLTTTCPPDGYYSFVSHTSACFSDDWHTLSEDHTAGDVNGNMLLVNGAPRPGVFLRTSISGLKSNTLYEIGLWLMNLCKPTRKCPFPLLPNLNVKMQTLEGRIVANIVTGDVPRVPEPHWTQYRAYFTTPSESSTLILVMSDNTPGGCGNDFALDDITFRECVKQPPQLTVTPKPATRQPPAVSKPVVKKVTAPQEKKVQVEVIKPGNDTPSKTSTAVNQSQKLVSSVPLVLRTRENALVRQIETEAGEIKIDIYDNGEIDGDTVTVYHNNALVKSHMRLSQKPISLTIPINSSQPHHEIIMVADNLGSIPPNTSVMIITTPTRRYQVFISSSEQKNAKVVFDLKK